MIVPVENDHAIIAEIKSIQLSRSKFGISVPGSSDGILDHGKAKRIVRLEYGKIVRRSLAVAKRIVHDVVG